MAHIQISELIHAPRNEVFDYLTKPSNQPELLAPTIEVEVVTPDGDLKRGNEVHFNMTRFGLSQSIRFRIEDVLPGSRLTYRQTEGVFRSWVHTMKFEDHSENVTIVTDLVDYQLPLGIFGYLADDLLIKGDMTRLLRRRLVRTQEHFGVPLNADAGAEV